MALLCSTRKLSIHDSCLCPFVIPDSHAFAEIPVATPNLDSKCFFETMNSEFQYESEQSLHSILEHQFEEVNQKRNVFAQKLTIVIICRMPVFSL